MVMRLELGLIPKLEQRLKLAPQIIQSVEILQLPLLALETRINQELAENPMLEIREEPEETAPELSAEEERPESTREELDFDRVDQLDEEWQDYFYPSGRRPSPDEADPKFEAMQNTAERQASLQDYLLQQYRLTDAPKELAEIAENIICNIDDNGYLRYPLEELTSSLEGRVTLAQAQAALKLVQALDPPGVGARSLKECLLLQLNPQDPRYDIERELTSKYLDQLLANKFPLVARQSGHSLEEINEAVALIGTLNPHPGSLFVNEKEEAAMYGRPEITIQETESGYAVRLQDEHIPQLYISPHYRRLLKDPNTPPETREYLKKKIQSARWLIDAVAQRKRTVEGVSRAIVEVQQEFFQNGISHLKPLRMQDVADRVGVHVSTVSRAISGKYVQAPAGVYPLKFFFTGGTQSEDGQLASWKSVKQKIVDLVDREDKSHPWSDEQVVNILKEQGLNLARRTVAKYRTELGIPSSRLRRKY